MNPVSIWDNICDLIKCEADVGIASSEHRPRTIKLYKHTDFDVFIIFSQ